VVFLATSNHQTVLPAQNAEKFTLYTQVMGPQTTAKYNNNFHNGTAYMHIKLVQNSHNVYKVCNVQILSIISLSKNVSN